MISSEGSRLQDEPAFLEDREWSLQLGPSDLCFLLSCYPAMNLQKPQADRRSTPTAIHTDVLPSPQLM